MRDNHEERAAAAARQAEVVAALADGLGHLAEGELTHRLDRVFASEYEQLRVDFNTAMSGLQETMRTIVATTQGIHAGTGEISSAADDLSRRTEQQAASLEETAAALDEITATVKKTAQGALHAREVVTAAKGDARGERHRRAPRGRGDERHPDVVAADRPDHRRDRRDRLPDEPAGLERGGRGGARGRCGARVRGGGVRGAGAGAALGGGGEGDQGSDLGVCGACRAGGRPRRRDGALAGADRLSGDGDQRDRGGHRGLGAGAGDGAGRGEHGGQPDGPGDAAERRHGGRIHRREPRPDRRG